MLRILPPGLLTLFQQRQIQLDSGFERLVHAGSQVVARPEIPPR